VTYQIRFTPAAMRGFRAIPVEVVGYVRAAIDALADDPRPSGCEAIGENTYRIAEWGHLIEYEVYDREVIIRVIFVL
jgi:mRNA interferase RelE/StbE